MPDPEKYEYESIPSPRGQGRTMLTIWAPGTWFGHEGHVAFVGGCGIGEFTSLAVAEKHLLARAQEHCERQIAEAQARVQHYGIELERLKRTGLRPLARTASS